MSIEQISTQPGGLAALLEGQSPAAAKKEDPLGRDAFLTMLVAQLRHQDPLNPLEGTDFTAQLAQFSGLEQQFATNDHLKEILAGMASRSEDNLLDYIGKEVVSKDNSLRLQGGSISGGAYTLEAPGQVMVTIYDGAGLEVHRLYPGHQPAGTHQLQWSGIDHAGTPMPDSTYFYDVTAISAQGELLSAQPHRAGTVTGVTYQNGTGLLVLDDQLIDPSTVIEVRMSP